MPAIMTLPNLYRFGDLHIDLVRRRVERTGATVDVSGLSFDLFAFLLRAGERVVSFDELIAGVWAPAVVGEETVSQRVKLLRQALGDDGRNPRYVRSVRGRGYQLCDVPEPLAEIAPKSSVRSRRRLAMFVLPLAIAITVLAAWFWRARVPPPIAHSAQTDLLERAQYYASIGQKDNNERAIDLYQQILAVDANHRAAKIGLSRAFSARVCLYNFPYEWSGRAQTLADEVVVVDAGNAAAYAALGYAHDCRGEIPAAIAGYERAFALDPSDDGSRASAANLYQVSGHLADALRTNLAIRADSGRVRFLEVQIARDLELLGFTAAAEKRYARSFALNPDNVFSNIAWPRFLFAQGRLAQAREVLTVAMTRKTDRIDLPILAGELALSSGDAAAAAQAFAQAASLRPQMSLPTTLAMVYGTSKPDADLLRKRITELQADNARAGANPETDLDVSLLQLASGDRKAAIAALGDAIAAGFLDKAYLQTSPLWKALAAEPGFAAAIDAINRRVVAERERVLAADWLPQDLLSDVRASP